MTKREREAMQKLVNRHSKYREEADNAFKTLQDLNEVEGTGTRWCSAVENMKDLLSQGRDYTWIYNKYIENSAKADVLEWELGGELAELNFWK